MGSPLRLAALGLTALAAASATVAPARADAAGDARATPNAFLEAIGHRDPKASCALFTPAALERLGGRKKCEQAFSDEDTQQDGEALQALSRAYSAARRSAATRHGRFVTKQFGVRKLARDIERRDPELKVELGRGPSAAAGQLVTTVVVDVRSTARRLVLYAESDDGSIFRLSVPASGDPDLAEVATGVPEAPPPATPEPAFAFAIDALIPTEDGAVLAQVTFTVTEDGETESYRVLIVLVPVGGAYLVDDLYYSALAQP